jgi:hypothetical protein
MASTRHISVFTATLLTVGLLAGRGQAQTLETPRARQGYWVGVGLAYAAPRVVEEGTDKGFYQANVLQVRLGQLITEHLGLGLFFESGGLAKNKDKGSIGGLGMEANLNVWRNLGVGVGAGFGFVMLTDDATEAKTLRGGAGSYAMLGASYDFFPWRHRLTGGWAVTPSLDVRIMPDGNVKTYTGFLGVRVTWWSGLERNMLKLPED